MSDAKSLTTFKDAAAKLQRRAKRDALLEVGIEACRIASLAAGCYGSLAYMEAHYGISPDYAKKVEDVWMPEVIHFIADEHGVEVTMNELAGWMRDAWRELADSWMADD